MSFPSVADRDDNDDSFATFDELVATYEKKIFNVVYRVLGDYEEAADLTQETFISAYKSFDRFRGDAKIYTWLYQIAINHCRNRLRQRGRARALHIESLDQPREWDDESESSGREIADLTQAPHTILEEKELRQRILAAVHSLPPDYREVVVLREIHGLSYNEIAEATRLSLDNVKTRLSRARAMLRRKLEPYYRD
jgi:RNA polymerase sigma-70 factor (ECF subfamily)